MIRNQFITLRNGKLKQKNQALILFSFPGWLNSSRWGKASLYKSILLNKKRNVKEYHHFETLGKLTNLGIEHQHLLTSQHMRHRYCVPPAGGGQHHLYSWEGINPESYQALCPLANLQKYRRTCWTPSWLCSRQNPDLGKLQVKCPSLFNRELVRKERDGRRNL